MRKRLALLVSLYKAYYFQYVASSLDRIQLDIQDLRDSWVLRLPYPSRTNNSQPLTHIHTHHYPASFNTNNKRKQDKPKAHSTTSNSSRSLVGEMRIPKSTIIVFLLLIILLG